VGGAHVLHDGVGSPVTQVFGLGLAGEVADAELERIERFYESHGASIDIELCPLAGPQLAARLAARGYRPIEHSNVLVLPLATAVERASDAALDVRPIRNGEEALWADVAARGWSMGRASADGWSATPELEAFVREIGPITAGREDGVSFLALLRSEPIAAGARCLFGGVALLAGASTVPEARRLGAQRALLDARLCFAREQSCDVASMVVEPGSASQRNGERHGFRVVYTRTKWQRSRS
jgi:GNAT superfamily N-acetyltransferase